MSTMESNEWKTVTRGRYVPPSKRAEMEKLVAEEEKKKPLDFESDKAFPTLGAKKVEVNAAWGKKKFTETIEDLIALEQRTAEEQEAAEEEAKKNEGNTMLPLPRSEEDKRKISERFYEWAVKEREFLEALEMGYHGAEIVEGKITQTFLAQYATTGDVLEDFLPSYTRITVGTEPQTATSYGKKAKAQERGMKWITDLLERKRATMRAAAAAAAEAAH
jgi:hypothetical protein